jgi:hypothetical protein
MAGCVKVPVIVVEWYRRRIGTILLVASTTRVYSGMGVHLKKNSKGFPMFFTFGNF